MVQSRTAPVYLHLFYPSGKPEDSRSGVAQGSQYMNTPSPLDALALKPSDFWNVGVNRQVRVPCVMVISVIILFAVCIVSCSSAIEEVLDNFFQDPNVEPIRASVKTAVPLAYAAAFSMAAFKGTIPTGGGYDLTVEKKCGQASCGAYISFTMNNEDLPFLNEEEGTVTVIGWWSSPVSERAILTVTFNEQSFGVPTFPVGSISNFPVMATAKGYRVVYANLDITLEPESPEELTEDQQTERIEALNTEVYENADAESANANVEMDMWIVDIDLNGSPADFSDDVYRISGGGQYVNVTESHQHTISDVYQLGMAGIRISRACSTNPDDGFAVIQELSAGGDNSPMVASAILFFENGRCNGDIQVALATGNYMADINSSLDFNLNQP